MQFGTYSVRTVVESGGMGTVYRADDPEGRVVAVKVPHTKLDPRLFDVEMDVAVLLSGQTTAVVTVLDFGWQGRCGYLVTELLFGADLFTTLQGRKVASETLIVEVLEGVCTALTTAHSHGIIHRDIKPENIFVCYSGRIVLLDFGIASSPLQTEGIFAGTPATAAPEVVRRETTGTPASDVYGLGAVLYRMLTGFYPPISEELSVCPTPALEFLEGTPDYLKYLCKRMLRKNPADRPSVGTIMWKIRWYQ